MAPRPERKPTRRRFTLIQVRRRIKAILLEVAAIGGGYDLTAAELRLRALALQVRVQELIDRFPRG